jgi:hypothetical protein
MMAQTVQLAFRLAFAWALGFLLAVAVRAVLPDQMGFTVTSSKATIYLPFSRVGFWTCILAALTVTAWVVIRAMLFDLGLRPLR